MKNDTIEDKTDLINYLKETSTISVPDHVISVPDHVIDSINKRNLIELFVDDLNFNLLYTKCKIVARAYPKSKIPSPGFKTRITKYETRLITTRTILNLVETSAAELAEYVKLTKPDILSLYRFDLLHANIKTGAPTDPVLKIINPETFEVSEDHGYYKIGILIRYMMIWNDV